MSTLICTSLTWNSCLRARANEVNRQSTKNEAELSAETNKVTSFTKDFVRPGGLIRVPVHVNNDSLNVKYQQEQHTQTAEEVIQIQKALCHMIYSRDVDNDCGIDLSHCLRRGRIIRKISI